MRPLAYADDIRANSHSSPTNVLQITQEFVEMPDLLRSRIHSNRLLLYPAQTQLLWFDTGSQLSKIGHLSLRSAFPDQSFCSSVRDLGIIFNCDVTFMEHILLQFRHFHQLRVICIWPATGFHAAHESI